MDDLDSLLVDLGKRKDAGMSQRKTRPPTSRVDLNELASLMEVLAAPSNTPGSPNNATSSTNQSFDQLSGGGQSRPVSYMATPSQSSSGRKDTSVDDLDALMESLSANAGGSVASTMSGNNSSSNGHAPPLGGQRGGQGGTVGKQLGSQFFSFAEPQVDSSFVPPASTQPQSRPVSGFPVADMYAAQTNSSPSLGGGGGYQSNRPPSSMYGGVPPLSEYNSSRPATSAFPSQDYGAAPTYSPNSRPVSNAYNDNYGAPPISSSANNPYSSSSANLPTYTPPSAAGNRSSENYSSPGTLRNKGQPDELDNLLSSLTNQMDSFEPNRALQPPSHVQAPIMGMGGGMSTYGGSSMNSMGLQASGPAKGTCKACQQPIYGEVVQALGHQFHPEHFSCGSCRSPIGTGVFYEHNGQPTCDRCYKEAACPKCAHCEKPIMDRCVTAIGKKWHAEHFICTQCLRPFEGGVFFERDGRPYCEADFYNVFAPKCAGCGESVRGDCITALGHQWHPEHFQCNYCQKSLVNATFFEFGGKPFCEAHYHMQTGSTCNGCGKAITGRSVTALGKKWHPEHFVCAFCMNPLSGGSYTEHNTKAYCKECHCKLFGN